MQHVLPALLLLLAATPALAAPGAGVSTPGDPPRLAMEGADAAAGYLTLTWSGAPKGAEYQVEASSQADFSNAVVRYQGPQTATVRSGLVNGTYHYRVRARPSGEPGWGAWSDPLVFEVAHHSLRLALFLFGVGAVVFIGTLMFLVGASRKVETRD